MGIGKRYLLLTGSVTLLCVVALGLLSHSVLEREIMKQYRDKAEVLLHSMKAVRRHFREAVRPAATFELGQERFITPLQSTSFAARGVFRQIPDEFRAGMDFHIASTKPLNPDNRATPLEVELIEMLDRHHRRNQPLEWRGVREVNGVDTYIIALGEVNRPACLRCHSTREAAPEDLRDAYDFSGPPRRADHVESAEIVYVPMSSIAGMVHRADQGMVMLAGMAFLFMTGAMYFSFAGLIKRPVTLLREHADSIAAGDLDHVSEHAFQGEFAHLKTAMDAMVAALKKEIARTETQRAEVQQKHEQLMTIINSSTDLIHMKDTEQRYLFANKAYETLLGVKPEDTVGKLAHEFVEKEFADQCSASDHMALARGHSMVVERWGERWFQTIKRSVTDANGEVIGIVGVISDITATRKAQDLELKKARAEAASKAKTEFLAIMSHEIRTPMNVMLGMVELLGESEPSEEQAVYIDTLQRSGLHLLALINDVLDFSKIEAGEVRIRTQPFVLESLLADVADAASVAARNKGLEFSLRNTLSDDSLRMGDAQRLLQVLMNLVQNAIKFSHEGGVELHVEPEHPDSQDEVLFRVTDSGIGIAPDKLPTIFNAFTQGGDTLNIQEGGTGLGLAICKRLVELMGGAIWIESTEGSGTTVLCRLPLPLAENGHEAAAPAAEISAPETRNIRVLLAEDMEDNRALVSRFLARQNMTLDFAHDGVEAVRMATEQTYDIILMDIRMPNMDGIEATRTIRKWERENGAPMVPIVALTAHAFQEYRDQCMAAGCTDYLTKPISKKQLASAIISTARQESAIE